MFYIIFLSIFVMSCSIFQSNSQAEVKPVYTPPYEFVRVKGTDLVVGSNDTKVI
ncbi:MAG: hypothetical protein WHS77_07550 [Brevinematales bacterium]